MNSIAPGRLHTWSYFPHDRQMAKRVGAGAYVRWMDDQSFGVASYSAGLKVLRHCDASLARLHLAPNTAKTKILSLAEASRHFHLEVNDELDEIGLLPQDSSADRALIGERIEELWTRSARIGEDRRRVGEGLETILSPRWHWWKEFSSQPSQERCS